MSKFNFSKAVLAWFDQHGRKDLPWQKPITPYRVYISEIMLQQTQVATVIPYFERFMARFPTVEKLAAAPLDEVLHLWTGLGYYARARNLHKTAKLILEKYQGVFPSSHAELVTLPGIGASTAAAIGAIVFEQAEAILDGNVKRVLARYHGVDKWPGIKKVEESLWLHAKQHLPKTRIRDYTQAMMDMGATVCTRSKPSCATCPLQKSCLAFASGDPLRFPGAKPKKVIPAKSATLLLVRDEQRRILLCKQPMIGIWGGLWSLPQLKGTLEQWCEKWGGLRIIKKKSLNSFRHTFSHYHLDITPIEIEVKHVSLVVKEAENWLWYNPQKPIAIGLPQPVARLILLERS